jgi:hypothetical protein
VFASEEGGETSWWGVYKRWRKKKRKIEKKGGEKRFYGSE